MSNLERNRVGPGGPPLPRAIPVPAPRQIRMNPSMDDELEIDRQYLQEHQRHRPMNPNQHKNLVNANTMQGRPHPTEKSYVDGRSEIYNLNSDPLYPDGTLPGQKPRRPRRTSSHEEEIYSKIAYKRTPKSSETRVEPILIAFELLIIVLFALFVRYDDQASANPKNTKKNIPQGPFDPANQNMNNYRSSDGYDNRFGNDRRPQQGGNYDPLLSDENRIDVPEQNLLPFYFCKFYF